MPIDHASRQLMPTQMETSISAAILMGAAFAMQAEAQSIVAKGIPHGDATQAMRVRFLLDLADGMAKSSRAIQSGAGR
jgi:hypothetical protein